MITKESNFRKFYPELSDKARITATTLRVGIDCFDRSPSVKEKDWMRGDEKSFC